MAMRQQRGGRHGPNRPRIGARPVYEEFNPITEWKHDEKSDILLVYLPGFTKEQLKVSTEGTNTLRIRGERLVGGNKWNRFQEDATIPSDCDIKSIRAKFEGGILTITMPKIETAITSSQQVQPKKKHETEEKTTQTQPKASLPLPPPPPLRLPSPPRQQVQPTHDKPRFEDVQEVHKKANANGKKTVSSSSSSSSSDDEKKKKVAAAPAETSKSPPMAGGKGREAQLPTVATDNRNDVIGKQTKKTVETAPHRPADDTKGKKKEAAAVTSSGGAFSAAPGGIGGLNLDKYKRPVKEKFAKLKEDTVAGTSSGGAFSAAPGGIGGVNLDKYKRAVKEKFTNTSQLKEERQLLVNMGVAVLVIVALGAYVAYTYGRSRKE